MNAHTFVLGLPLCTAFELRYTANQEQCPEDNLLSTITTLCPRYFPRVLPDDSNVSFSFH
jgi:hypothetical protein